MEGPAQAPQQAWAAGRFDFWRKSGIDLVPLLVHLGSESDLPMVSEFPLSKYVVFSWLGHLADEEAVEFLLELVDSAFEEGIRSRHDVHYLMYLFNCLGCSGHAKALEFLFNAQSREFWEGTGPNFELPAIEGAMTSEEHAAMRRRMLRESALQAIAASGTERALKALATGQGISPRFHDDLEYLFAVAARTSVGIPGFPENVGRSVPDDKLEALESVCERYGMELFLLRPDE
ncbi:MAG: hypothetical protein GY851_15850 [bacterium]|nr:hypothetical protein [bacterium]